jgi:acetylxylan esterase
MQNVLAATVPDLFTAGTAYAGVPAGCFATTLTGPSAINAWNDSCAKGRTSFPTATLASRALGMRPGYKGPRPKLQLYHGSKDDVLLPQNYREEMKQWCGVLGYDPERPRSVRKDVPQKGYTTSVYGPLLEGVYAEGVGHNVPVVGERDMAWFGIK